LGKQATLRVKLRVHELELEVVRETRAKAVYKAQITTKAAHTRKKNAAQQGAEEAKTP